MTERKQWRRLDGR